MQLTPELLKEIEQESPEERGRWLFLEPHDEFQGAWYVWSLDPAFLFEFEDIVGSYSVVFPHQLSDFYARCSEEQYRPVFTADPSDILTAYESLNDVPPFAIESTLEGTINGFLPWQIKGFNKLVRSEDLRGGLCLWDTGTGKTVFIAMAIRWHMIERQEADIALVVVKKNNKRDMQRKLKKLMDIESVILDGTRTKRWDKYLEAIEGGVFILNYEKWREDQPFFETLISDRRVLIFWDEMPTKLKNRNTQLYGSVRDALYVPWKRAVVWDRKRPAWLRQYELTATPIETDPDNQFSCIRLIDPDVLGNISEFQKEYVLRRNPISKAPEVWTNVDKIGHKLSFMTHRVDKTDPEVAKYFPAIMEEPVVIDWDPKLRKAYDALTDTALAALEGESEPISIFSMLMVMRMLCNAPSMVTRSASNREAFEEALSSAIENEDTDLLAGIPTGSEAALRLLERIKTPLADDRHTKLDRLYEDLVIRHPGEKALLFSTFSDYIFPVFEHYLTQWGISYVIYRGTDKRRQEAKDFWRTEDDSRVLVCSDAGSDSVDLPEASVVINYDLPTLYSRKYQRIHRASRADSIHPTLWVYNYLMADSVEERAQELIEQRYGYHTDFLDTASKLMRSASLSRDDYLYMLTGRRD